MIKINSERFKLLIIYYSNNINYIYGYFNIMISSSKSKKEKAPIYYDTTKLLFMNTKHNTMIKVDYYAFRYYNCSIITNLDPKKNYFIEVCI